MAGEKPSPNSFVGGGRNHAVEREPCPLQGIGEGAGLLNHDRGAAILREISGVARELRNEGGGSARSVRRQRDKGGVRIAVAAVDGRQ